MPIGHFSQIIRSLMCLRFGMPTTINYLFVPNGKLVFTVSQYLSILGYSMPTCYENSRNRDSLDSCHRCPKMEQFGLTKQKWVKKLPVE